MKGKTTIWWLVQNIGSKFFLTVFWFRGLIPASKKPVKLIRYQKWSGHDMSKETDQALYSLFFSKTIFWGVGRKWRAKQQYAGWSRILVLKSSWPFFGFREASKKSAKLIMSKETDQALCSSFFQKTYFGGFGGLGENEGQNNNMLAGREYWSTIGFQQVYEANPLSKIVCSWFVERKISSALQFIFLKTHVFWDFGGWEKMKDKTTTCWLVQNFGSKFFKTVFSSLGGS